MLAMIILIAACKKSSTPPPAPVIATLTTTAASGITSTTAISGGTISSDGRAGITARGVCWSTSTSPTVENNKTNDGTGTGSFVSSLTGLTAGTTYYIRAYATNSAGIAYGNEVSFSSGATLATITTTAASAITTITATSGGNISNDGGAAITERGICFNTNTNPTTSNTKVVSGSGIGSFTSDITGLTPGIIYYVRAYAINSAGTAYGNEINFTTNATEVTICTQIWMVKNLDVSTYRNGDPIPLVTFGPAWETLTTGAYCYYENNTANGTVYGKLYNWYAVNDPRGLAPAGWHIPTDAEWAILSTCLGGDLVSGGKMKETGTTHWPSPNTGATNSSGFTGLPGAIRFSGGSFGNSGFGFWWSSTEKDASNAWYRYLGYNFAELARTNDPKQAGFSVRCVKD